ncbi:MAG: Hsp33 family molecular chaperone HslO, partial [Ruminococcaceae bacterium]|nr:Hsp33 family molecular chaperone HslO [Oscillospiraceae bacterium]
MKNSKIIRAITSDGSARLFFEDSTAIVQRAQSIHGTSKTATADALSSLDDSGA